MDYVLHILILVGIYVVLALSLNLLAGYTGLLSIAHAAFFGIGAYAVALMALTLGTSVWINVACAVIASGALGLVVSIPSLRIRDDYFVIVTFAFQVIVFNVLNNWVSFTGGPNGLPGIPQPVLFGWRPSTHFEFLCLVGCLAAAVFWVCRRLVTSPIGRVLRAIREDEVFVQACGKNPAAYKVVVCVISAIMAGVAGAVYAYYVSFIDPTSFTVAESIFIISIVIIGGAGNLWGPVLGALVLVTLPEVLRFLGLPSSIAANVRQVVYGALLVLCMMLRPQGLIGENVFQKNGRT